MREFIRIGVDLGKTCFQLHALEGEGGPAVNRKLSRSKMRAFFAQTAPCRVGMEACGSAHYWARELAAMGHEVVLMPPAYIKPYVKRGKNDAVDAAAVCEAMSRPGMRFVPIKSGRDFAAWLGLTPRQQSSGGKAKLGAITKQGNRYLRKMLVVGCTSALRVAARRKGVLADWIAALRARKPERLVAVALANKLARICWAIMTTGEVFRQEIFAKA